VTTSTRLRAGDAAVTVVSNTASVTDWSQRYFGSWWNAATEPGAGSGGGSCVHADVDQNAVDSIAMAVASRQHRAVVYAKATTFVTDDEEDTILAVSPAQRIAYRSEPDTGQFTVTGPDPHEVALAAARLAREAIRGQLLAAGWAVVHASAVVRDGQAVLAFGDKGAGKTTTALLLARAGWELLANDRVFARATPSGTAVLPWPAAAAVGLGLLDSLGWYDRARTRLQAGEQLHPTQDQRVTDALLAGSREPLWEKDGHRELKAQVFPDQFLGWFGLRLATSGHAARLLFPRVHPIADPALVEADRGLDDRDFMSGATEDRYPDIFGLARGLDPGGQPDARTQLARGLGAVPHSHFVLGHDAAANGDFLSSVVDAST